MDAYSERHYQKMRPLIVGDVSGTVLEAGVGTGRNFSFYPKDIQLTAFDISEEMLQLAKKRIPKTLHVHLTQADACILEEMPNNHFDWYVSTFLFCVLPEHSQPLALQQLVRVLKPGGKFRLLEMVYSKKPIDRLKQKCFAPLIKWIYGARFDQPTYNLVLNHDQLTNIHTRFLRKDTYLLIEGEKK